MLRPLAPRTFVSVRTFTTAPTTSIWNTWNRFFKSTPPTPAAPTPPQPLASASTPVPPTPVLPAKTETETAAPIKGRMLDRDRELLAKLLDRDGGSAAIPIVNGKYAEGLGPETKKNMFRLI